ncbi:ImmA/IrrE family metallo-endopeptidase [Lysinibacillus irui]|uniref:ImmA/IrrE family metallo-endopeptidase n=1 Tax=Lysinibacillus irui TaxID=2998077 RepID=UPI002AD32D6F|nr:ImmA/IrrE family metallo-endopeptidase [Lysinibacillus irui]MEA0563317.1 ImmA/IrrE family metallo-endopeptidase [Lysinibacillus irui]
MGWIKKKVEYLFKKYNTRNPFTLANYLNIEIFYWDLPPDIKGFYQYEKRNRFIFINSNLSFEEQLIVCAHELGHAVLHTKLNTPFMRANTLFSINKVEIQANTFAAYLLIPDENLFDSHNQMTLYDIAALYNVPLELVELKFKGLF